MKTAYAYTKTCVGEPAGVEVIAQQIEAIRRYGRDHCIEIVGEYRDLNVDTSNEMGRRYGLYEIMLEAVNNGVSSIIVERPEAIAHDTLVRAILLAALEDHGFRGLYTLNGANLFANDDPMLSLARRIYRAYMDAIRVTLPLKLRMARNRVRKERGWCEGAKPFGHYPGEQETLKRILQLRRKPCGKPKRTYQAIADILNAEGQPTRFGGPWSKAAVHRIVKRHESQKLHALLQQS